MTFPECNNRDFDLTTRAYPRWHAIVVVVMTTLSTRWQQGRNSRAPGKKQKKNPVECKGERKHRTSADKRPEVDNKYLLFTLLSYIYFLFIFYRPEFSFEESSRFLSIFVNEHQQHKHVRGNLTRFFSMSILLENKCFLRWEI